MKFCVPATLVIFLQFLSPSLKAQPGTFQVTGQVTDQASKQAVGYATVSLFKAGSTSPLTGASTDDGGKFRFDKLGAGDYRITVDFLGYQKRSLSFSLSATIPVKSLGIILLLPAASTLKEITVTSTAATVVNKIDKMVYSPANDLTSMGGAALDVLKKVPMVTVDIDGNVELQGNANIKFLINGKSSTIFGSSLADALQSIPASQIKSIEVMTVPGAKYDAQGTGGVINIILKESKVEGINGSVNLSAGTRLENAAVNLNVKKGKFGANLFFSGNEQLNSTARIGSNRTSFNAARDTLNTFNQQGHNAFIRGGYEGGLSFTYSLSPKDEFTLSLGLDRYSNHNTGQYDQQQQTLIGNQVSDQILSLRSSVNKFENLSREGSIAYKKTFGENHELDLLYNSSYSTNSGFSSQNQDYQTGQPFTGTRSNNPGKDHQTEISLDYTQPVSKTVSLETGAKVILEKLDNSVLTDTLLPSRTYAANAGQSYGFQYDRKIYAAYLSATFSLFHKFLDIKSGLRYEYTSTNANFPGVHIPGFSIFAPTLVFSHKLNEKELVKLSYTYRIERPDYDGLNPFYNISDPHNINTGNPNLKSEIGHNFEAGLNSSFGKGSSIYIAAIYRYNTQDIQSFTTYYPVLKLNGVTYTDVSLNQRYNIGSETSAGLNIYGSVQVVPKFSLRSNIFLVDRISTNPGNPTVNGPAYRVNLNGSYEFGNDLAAEFFVNYRSSQRTIQGYSAAFFFYNLAIRKQFFKKKASIGLTAANPFNQYVMQHPRTYGPNFSQFNTREVPFRSFGISLSYKFGHLAFKESDKEDKAAPVPAEN